MRKLLALVPLPSTWSAWAQVPVRALVNRVPIDFTSTTTPKNRRGTVMVPANQVFSRLNFAVGYNVTTRLGTATKPGGTYSVAFTPDSPYATVNGQAVTLSAAQTPYTKDNYFVMPPQLVSETANCRVDFDQEMQ